MIGINVPPAAPAAGGAACAVINILVYLLSVIIISDGNLSAQTMHLLYNLFIKNARVKWNLGGHNSTSIYTDAMYGYERAGTNKWSGKVALMYPSDYGYATDFNICDNDLYWYDEGGCYDNDWLYNEYTWMLSPSSSGAGYAWYVFGGGYVYDDRVYYARAVFPVLYLDSELTIESGEGSKEKPYIVR